MEEPGVPEHDLQDLADRIEALAEKVEALRGFL